MEVPNAFYRVSVKGIYENEDWKYMLSKKWWKRWLAWWWIDHGETFQDALVREIDEELSLKVISVASKPDFFLTRLTKWWRHIANILVQMKIENIDTYKPSEESNEIWLFEYDELIEMKDDVRPWTYQWIESIKV